MVRLTQQKNIFVKAAHWHLQKLL